MNDEMREACGLYAAFEEWKEGNERWEYASPLTAFQAAYQLQQKRIEELTFWRDIEKKRLSAIYVDRLEQALKDIASLKGIDDLEIIRVINETGLRQIAVDALTKEKP